jgi:glutamine amidotransferase
VQNLDALGLRAVLDEKVMGCGAPILGICMGMQVMTERSEEGEGAGLGWIRGATRRFRFAANGNERAPKIPNMGWHYVAPAREHPLLEALPADPRFYFVHSYWVECADPGDVLLRSRHGGQVFAAALARGNVAGVQFHVEKSHLFGMKMLASFARWSPRA